MTKEQLERLLNTACEIITDVEGVYFATREDLDMQQRIDALFNEIKYSDHLDADMEAQDWSKFGKNKI